MTKFIPYPFFYDDVPIDLSFVFERESPAGKHGFLKANGRKFVFDDGTEANFWGTNFNGAACFPEHSYAEKLAKRLSKIGINLVRLHQLEAEWHTPNLLSFTKGKRVTDAKFDSESLDRLDYLVYCLKQRGIYCYLDMLTYRKFKSDEGVENAVDLPDAAKPYCIFSDHLIELQKEYCTQIWTHQNPYTGLTYADDPVFVLTDIVCECDLFYSGKPIVLEPYKSEFLKKFDVWLSSAGISKSASDYDLLDYTDETLIDFKIDLQEQYYRIMIEHMRNCGVKIPITGNNWASSPANLKTQLATDFYDAHTYRYDWKWKEFEGRCHNKAITHEQMSFLGFCALNTSANKPTYISEWDMPWPNEYRAESPIYCAAIGRLQGWGGFAIHSYAYSTKLDRMNILGKEISAQKIGNIPYRQGIFSTWNDPAKFGLFYHAALITRRGDVAPANEVVCFHHRSKTELNRPQAYDNFEKHMVIYDTSEFDPSVEMSDPEDFGEVLSDTKELYRNWKRNYGYINTPRTKCAYGFLAKNGELELSGVKIDCKTDFATIAISALDDNGICSSDNMLLTAVGRAKNTDSKFEGELMLDIGKPPVLIEVIEADIEIETSVEGLVVHAISAEGYDIGTVPTVREKNKLKFTLGTESQSMYYLITKE